MVEHLVNPVPFLRSIRNFLRQGATAAIFSTPERDLTRGKSDNGPPDNLSHVREWNFEEFSALIQWAGFELIHLGLTRSNDAEPDKKTILAIVCYGNSAGRDKQPLKRKGSLLEGMQTASFGRSSGGESARRVE